MNANAVQPSVALLQLATSFWIARAISVAAKLRIADLIADEPRAYDDLARDAGVHAPTLYRILRALASVGVFIEVDRPLRPHPDGGEPPDGRPELDPRLCGHAR
jgi:hypothetical protein